MTFEYNLGTVVQLKKQHPCGSYNWEVIRLGADIKIKCQGCEHVVMLSRSHFEKNIKKVVKP
jgi:hypothetical protein